MMKLLQSSSSVFCWVRRLLFSLFALSLCLTLKAQSFEVEGTVLDDVGDPVPGVNVLIKNTTQGTVTNLNGIYRIEVPNENSVLIFSFVGYQTVEMPVNGQSLLDVSLPPDAEQLTEVVVTALGIEKEKKALGYAVQEVSGEGLQKAREPNVARSLSGKVAGLNVYNPTGLFEDPQLELRGRDPLIVIDGIPNPEADLWKISSDDVESIDVLKGPTASALYGSIGRDGAIMITTKRGSRGGVDVSINSSTMFQPSYIRIPDVQSTYGNGNNGSYAYIDGSGGGPEGGGWIWGPKLDQADPNTPSGYFETPQLNSPIDPQTGERIPTPFLSRGRDNVENFFRTGMLTTNNVSVSGGNEQGNFRVSLSNMYQKGMVPNTGLNSTTFSVAGGYQLADKLRADASLTYNKQYSDNFPERSYGPQNYLYNLVLWTGPDIDIRDLRNYWMEGQEGIQQRHFNTSWYNNPYFQAYEFLQGYNKDNNYGQISLTYEPLENLEILARSGINWYNTNRSVREPLSYIRYGVNSRGNLELSNEYNFNINTDIIATYKKQLAEELNISVSVGGANRYNNYRELNVNTDGLNVPEFYNLSNSTNNLTGNNLLQDQKVNSVYGTLDLEFLNSVFLTVTGRNDWISTLPVGNNSYFYPSVSLSTVISDIVPVPDVFSFLKVRGSWSQVSSGYINFDLTGFGEEYPYNQVQAYLPGTNWNNNASVYFPGTQISPDISPETTNSYEIGLDARFLEGRIGVDVAYYNMRDYNNITTIPVSEASGFTQRLVNGNEYRRRGLEVVLNARPVELNAFRWDVLVNWSRHRRELTDIYGGADELNNVQLGERADAYYTSDWLRSPQGDVIYGDNGFPLVDPFQRRVGYGDPDGVFGVSNTFTYKNFSLNVLFDGRYGGSFYSETNSKMWWGGTHPGSVNQFRDDANAGESTYVGEGVVIVDGAAEYDSDGNITSDSRTFAPNTQAVNYIAWTKDYYDGTPQQPGIFKETFMKLREVTLTYALPGAVLENIFFDQASVSFVGRNLFLWSDVPNIDPDQGEDALQTPSARSLGFNINLTF
ncbi:SusC/RagA family TonB-linked outer membrane protein [Catalinimonas niigatensis]|uniref:SusC/RagA family TonB-linked outer membrane protein n=1 Tax=Catalinimonas niigatensis TaxID=1397264 RepID=UPI0026650D95|nr:SusC/RagA family TonB-linked outer membrane protein [Catalinimonas niigatensis]WPP51993.1 SusC/RagA family TonB-linked outer membrane protein [Catalinimonas niigatensis]